LSSAADRAGLLLAAAYLVTALHGLGASDIVGDDEAREAGIVQDVVAGHWLWPRFNQDLLPDKPPLFHWLAAVPCALAGFSETAVRLPSAVAGAALVGWTAYVGNRLLGGPTGLVAAGLLATTPALFARARVARPDALLAFLLAAAFGCTFRAWRDRRRGDAVAGLVLLGAATLAKGPVAPALFAATLLAFLAWQGDLRRLPSLLPPGGLVAVVVLGLGWYAVALAGWGGLFVREHLIGRYVGNLLGQVVSDQAATSRPFARQPLFYLAQLAAIALPWTPFTALALWRARRAGGFGDPRLRFLLCWAAAPVIVFTPAVVKLRYYLLPALPALALITAPTVVALARRAARRPTPRNLAGVAGTLLVVSAAALALAGTRVLSRSDRGVLAAVLPLVPGGSAGAAVGLGFALGVLLVAVACRAWRAVIGLVAATQIAWLVVGAPTVEQAIARRDSLRAFGLAVAARYPAPARLAFYPQAMRAAALYIGRPVPIVRRPDQLVPGTAVICTEAAYHALAGDGRLGPPLLTAEGRVGNTARARVVLAETGVGPLDGAVHTVEAVSFALAAHQSGVGEGGDVLP